MAVRASTERNFRRTRATPARRTRLRARLSWTVLRRFLTVALVVFGAYETASLAFTAPALRVQSIAVKGNVRLSSGQVQAMVEDLRGASILRVDLEAFRRRLVESPWVADVALRRVLPSTIEVLVTERRPVALARLGQEVYLVDESGSLIDQFGPQYAEFDLPVVDGLAGPPAGSARLGSIDTRRAALAARVIAALGPERGPGLRLSQVDVSDPADAVVLLEGDPTLLHLGDDRFLERVQTYVDLSGALRDRIAEIDYVDLRFGHRLYVRPAAPARGARPTPPRGPSVTRF